MEQPSNKLAFTICSANYLAQAIALGDSLLQHNPRYTFVIGLVDEISDSTPLPIQISYPLIPIKDIEIPDFLSAVSVMISALTPYFEDSFLSRCENESGVK